MQRSFRYRFRLDPEDRPVHVPDDLVSRARPEARSRVYDEMNHAQEEDGCVVTNLM